MKNILLVLLIAISCTLSWAMVAHHQDLPKLPELRSAEPGIHKSTTNWDAFVTTTAPGWTALWASDSDIPWAAMGPPVPISTRISHSAVALEVGERFLRENIELLGITDNQWLSGNPKLVKNLWMIPFRETYHEIPVFGGRIDLRITSSGQLIAFFSNTHPEINLSTTPALSISACMSSLRSWRQFPPDLELEESAMEILPTENQTFLCWRLDIRGNEPHQRWTAWVDAHTGILRAAVSRVATDDVIGHVEGEALPHYWDDPPMGYDFPHENIRVDNLLTVSDTMGNWEITVPGSAPFDIYSQLSGPYVDVDYADGPDASHDTSASSPHDWTWDDSNARTDERNLYHHTNLVHDYYKVLDPDFTGMDYPVPAVCQHGNHYENAFWNGYGTYYGGGGNQFRNFALFCDVIYHEFTHGVTDQIYPPGYLPYIDQSGAMNEAWSDYFACTITDEPLVGEGGLYQSGQAYMRNLDNTLRYPENWQGEVHADGRIIGGAFWDLRERVGAEISDDLIHFTKYGLAEEFLAYFIDMLFVDDDDGNIANGSPHSIELYEAFGIHGIGPGIVPQLKIANHYFDDDETSPSSGNGNGFLEAGEIIELWLRIENEGMLYPPPAQDVTVQLSSLHGDLEVMQGNANIGDLPFGQSRWISTPVTFHVSGSNQGGFANLLVTLSANGGEVTEQDTMEIMLGIPTVLLADDDGGHPYQSYFENALRTADRTYVYRNVTSGIDPDDLALHPVVIWFCGDQSSQTVTADDQSTLTNHLESGGRLILTGQNIGEDISQTGFFQNVLGVIHTDDTLHNIVLDGLDGDIIGNNRWLLLAGAAGAQNQNSPSGTQAGSNAVEFFHYRDNPDNRAGAVRREDPNGYRTIYFSFGLEGISGLGGSTPLPDLLESCLDWLAEGLSAPDDQEIVTPLSWSLESPYPNPFNPTVTLEFSVPRVSNGTIAIYNILGQKVALLDRGPWMSGTRRVLWNAGNFPSGIYFVRLECPEIKLVRKMMLIK